MKITAKNVEKILYCDCRKEENRKMIQDVLHTIPQYKKIKGDVPLSLLEKLHYIVTTKYAVRMQWISFTTGYEGEKYWSVCFRNDEDFSRLESITSFDIYELFAKTAIFLFAMLKGYKGGLITREDLELKKIEEGWRDD